MANYSSGKFFFKKSSFFRKRFDMVYRTIYVHYVRVRGNKFITINH